MATASKNIVIDDVLNEVIERLVKTYQPEKIYLFGSRARGDDGPDSDYDILLIVPTDYPPEKRKWWLVHEALRGVGIPVQVLIMTRQYFEERLHLKASLPSTVIREGHLLYESRSDLNPRYPEMAHKSL